MRKLFIIGFLNLIILTYSPVSIFASNRVSESSANFKRPVPSPTISVNMPDIRIKKLESFLEKYNSPLSLYSNLIIETADEYHIPWTLLTAIAGVESGFCKIIPKNSYNCWGWNNGKFYFQDYHDGILTVSKNLRQKYFDRGLDTPEKMSFVYAPPSTSWAGKVHRLMEQIKNFESSSFLAIPLAI